MKTISNSFSWYNKSVWHWPSHDEKLRMVNDWVRDADIALKYVEDKKVCIQAGGACGVWPAYLATHFTQVLTFEPVRKNFKCLRENTKHIYNIKSFPCALSDRSEGVMMNLDDFEKDNCGAYYVSNKGRLIPAISIDSLRIERCDFIALDVEGYECKVLKGAKKTIEKCNPVIMLEEKPLPHMENSHLEAREYLVKLGYKQVDSIHRDVVFKR